MSSSPLKQAAARRLQRGRTVPIIPTNAFGEASHGSIRPAASRKPSEEFLALEHAHVVITSGASKMGLQELLEASKMANGINVALSDEMTRKLGDA